MEETALFSGKIYTADKNFTQLPVATVTTNSKSARDKDAILRSSFSFVETRRYTFIDVRELLISLGGEQHWRLS